MSQKQSVAIIGAGITGLVAAYHLKRNGFDVSIFEAAPKAGGLIQGSVDDNWVAESGYGLINYNDPVINRLIGELGLRDDVMELGALHKKRYLVQKKKYRRLPNSLRMATWSSALPFSMRLRLLFGRFIKKTVDPSDSIATFLEKYLGPMAVESIAEPLAKTLFAGNEHDLSVRNALPDLYEATASKRSLTRAMAAVLEARKLDLDQTSMVALRFGLPSLVGALADRLSEELILNARVIQVKKHQNKWLVTIDLGDEHRYFVADQVVFACSAPALADIAIGDKKNLDLQTIASMPHAPLTVINMGFKWADLKHKLDSAGFIVPRSEQNSLLGVQFTSSFIEERTPGGYNLITVFVGGVDNADFAKEPINHIKTKVLKDLDLYLGVRAYPPYVRAYSSPAAIPQFTQGYDQTREAIASFEHQHPGIHLIGQYRFGSGIERCISKTIDRMDDLIDVGK
jgi:protoporphyrinogen/coproporphyrinogen III oxidase